MSEKRRALGRGLGALIPSAPVGENGGRRPVDVFFRDNSAHRAEFGSIYGHVSRETSTAGPASSAPSDHAHGPIARDSPEAGPDASPDVSLDDGPDATQPPSDVSDDPASSAAASGPREGAPDDQASGASTRSRDELEQVPGARFAELPVGSIRPNPRQPRTAFDDDEMAELVHSIREIGVLQPIVVRPIPTDERETNASAETTATIAGNGHPADGHIYELVMGERRWRAALGAGLQSVPAIIKDTHDDDLLRDALLENLLRSQLNALEEAAAYQQLLDDFGCTHDELATRIGRSRPQISNTLRLLKLPPLVARRVAAGVLSAGHARALLGLADGAAMERLAQRIVAEGLSVRTVEEIVVLGGDEQPRAVRRPPAGNRHPQLDDLAAQLADRFDTRVHIALGQRKGKLTVEFASVEDLNRIVGLLGHSVPAM